MANSTKDIDFLHAIHKLRYDARVNYIYYDGRLRHIHRIYYVIGLTSIVASSGSGIASVVVPYLPQYDVVGVWRIFSILAGILAPISTMYGMKNRIALYTKQRITYQDNVNALDRLAHDLSQEWPPAETHRKRFKAVHEAYARAERSDETTVSQRRLRQAEHVARAERPEHDHWWPSDD